METKINIAELLKDCPKGMELDCTMFDDNCVEFSDIVDSKFLPIRCRIKKSDGGYNFYDFTKYGCWIDDDKAKCVIFPKGKTTWEGFHRPFEDGDVVVTEDDESFQLFLLKHLTHSEDDNSYDGYCYFGWDFQCNELFKKGNWGFNRLATEEEKQKLFQAIKDNGYKWNEETKTLEKLPKFKVGDKITKIDGSRKGEIFYIDVDKYHVAISNNIGIDVFFEDQDDWELTPNKFDINTLKPFESRVLIRDDDGGLWKPAIYGFSHPKGCYVVGGAYWKQCIPYEVNKELLGTTNDCNEYFKTW